MCLFPLALLVHRQLAETSWLKPCEMKFPFCHNHSLAHDFWELTARLSAAMCAGTSVKDSILVELSFLPSAFLLPCPSLPGVIEGDQVLDLLL